MLIIFFLCWGFFLNESYDIILFFFYYKDFLYYILKEMVVKLEKVKCVFLFMYRVVDGCWLNIVVWYICDKII